MVKLRVQKLELDLILFQKGRLERNVRPFFAHFFLLLSKAQYFYVTWEPFHGCRSPELFVAGVMWLV